MKRWVYILQSETTGRYYCGQTRDLNSPESPNTMTRTTISSKTTKRFSGPWLLGLQQVENGSESVKLERRIKQRGINVFSRLGPRQKT